MTKRHTLQSTARLVMLAFGLSLVMAVELAAGQGFLKALLAGELPWQAMAMVLLMIVVTTGAIINAFTATMRPEPMRTAGTMASCALAMTLGIEASHSVTKLPTMFYFAASYLGQLVFTYCLAYVIVGSIKVSGRWATIPPYVAMGAVAVVGIFGFVGQSWVSLETVTTALALTRDAALFALPIVVLGAVTFLRSLRLDPKSFKESLLLRLPLTAEGRTTLKALGVIGAGLTLGFAVNVLLHMTGLATDKTSGFAAWSVFSWGWIGLSLLSITELTMFSGEQRHGNVTAKLASSSAKLFLKRHLSEKDAWAATVGLKTTNYSIDHDPGSVLQGQLPASIMQIRGEEIQRCVNDVLGGMYLHSYVVGHRIFGAIDPEAAVRPCIDTLKMFACLYLDAGPLVERRIKGLTALLPIVDPGLSRVMKAKDLGQLINRVQWFFHFDFGWIDQHVIHTPRSTRYDVRMASLSSRVRHAMMSYLEKTGGVGNFVWIGPEARDRLLQEAPSMKNVIEACPITIDDPGAEGQDELLMFIIKFEQLIPRLQRYFDLDSMRKALLDFEPSQESSRLQNLLGLQIAKAKSAEEILEVLSSITSVPWRGFKEKDNALQLIMQAYLGLSKILMPGKNLSEATEPKLLALHDRVLDAVKAVGYPSQILHHAQVNKIALRDVKTLTDAAGDPRNARFCEAWLLMATTDYSRHRPDQRQALLQFIKSIPKNDGVATQRLVQVKAVDAFASLGRGCTEAEMPLLTEVAARVGEWFAQYEVDPDICCLFLDAQIFLSAQLGRGLELEAGVIHRLDTYFQQVASELGANHPKVIAVMSRWQEFRAKKLVTPNAA